MIGLLFLSSLFFASQHLLRLFSVSVPPALLGIAVLFVGLLLVKRVPSAISLSASPLLAHMSLFFIPAIVAIVNFTDLIMAFPLALFLAIVLATLVSLALTAWLSQLLMQKLNTGASDARAPFK